MQPSPGLVASWRACRLLRPPHLLLQLGCLLRPPVGVRGQERARPLVPRHLQDLLLLLPAQLQRRPWQLPQLGRPGLLRPPVSAPPDAGPRAWQEEEEARRPGGVLGTTAGTCRHQCASSAQPGPCTGCTHRHTLNPGPCVPAAPACARCSTVPTPDVHITASSAPPDRLGLPCPLLHRWYLEDPSKSIRDHWCRKSCNTCSSGSGGSGGGSSGSGECSRDRCLSCVAPASC